MKITQKMLIDEIKTLQRAAKIHAKYSISQYRQVLKYLDELEKEKKSLEQKVKQRTQYLEIEIKEREKLTNKLENIAKYDQLTGLANRYMFLNELEILYNEAVLLDKNFSILFIDLDGFKLINDTYGHEAGDIVLQTIAQRLKNIIRKSDIVSRLGGDEFTVILKDLDNIEKLKEISNNIILEISKPIVMNKIKLHVGASIGIYIFNKNDSLSDVITKADIAMYEAKKNGKGKFIFFDDKIKKEINQITTIKHQLKDVIKNNKIQNYFQPIVSSLDFKIKGFEVLARWDNISPATFIPILEEDISLLKEFTFKQIEEIVKILKKYNFNYFFSINISGKLLLNDDLIKFIDKMILKYNFDTSKIHFEVTETSLAININKASMILSNLKKKGFEISLDDFGTGYSSLAYIKNLPIYNIKIDKEFLLNLSTKKDIKLLRAIINMIEILDMKVILEGIETKHQLSTIKPKEYIKYQGFLFYKPISFEELKKIVD